MSGLTFAAQEIRKPSLGGGWFLVAVRCVGSPGWNLCQTRLTFDRADKRHSLTDTEVAHLHSGPFEIFLPVILLLYISNLKGNLAP